MAYKDKRPTAVFDEECYPNYWSIGFKCVDTGRTKFFEMKDDGPLDRMGIKRILKNWRVVGFNSTNYDMPMLSLAMRDGVTNGELKRASDAIILSDMRPWQFFDHYGTSLPDWIDHIDLMEVSPGSPTKPSLKVYAGRLHHKTMRDLPYEPDMVMTEAELDGPDGVRVYHGNDLNVTDDFHTELKAQIEIRAEMSDVYGIDLRSKSDAQIAEAVIVAECERMNKRRIYRQDIKPGTFFYKAPEHIKFKTKQFQDMLRMITTSAFTVDRAGIVHMPKALEDFSLTINGGTYRMGSGGLHSSESAQFLQIDDLYELVDTDATSYYPKLIIDGGYFPAHIGSVFLRVYRVLYERRLAAKKAATITEELIKRAVDPDEIAKLKWILRNNQNIAETLKIILNGAFGKLGSPFSKIYSPSLMIQTTLTGQLDMLMLIEDLELRGLHCVSANTDGFVSYIERSRRDEFNAVVFDWECTTGLSTEKTYYRILASRDVNNYIAIGVDGKVKTKGTYAPAGPGQKGAAGMKKNPNAEVSIDAVIALLKEGTPIDETVRKCVDIRKFVMIRKVKGGAEKGGESIGKVIRWAYRANERNAINYKMNGNTVPRTEGAWPLMELPEEFPDWIDHDWYVREAHAIMQDIGMPVLDPTLRGRKGHMNARLPDQKTYHVVKLPVGVALCGRGPDSMRDAWIEDGYLGQKICSKCLREQTL